MRHLRELREGFRILGSRKFWADFVAYYRRQFTEAAHRHDAEAEEERG